MFVEVFQSDLGMLVIGQLGKIALLFKMATRQFGFGFTIKKPEFLKRLK